MAKIPSWRRYRELLGPDAERDVRDEVSFHLETETEELIASGLSPDEARRQALARFGDVGGALAECRESDRRRLGRRRRGLILDALGQDVRYAARGLLKRPGFAATVILILALGIGANAAVFSIVDPLFFQMPGGVRAPNEVKQIYVERQRSKGDRYFQARFSLPEARFIDSSIAAGGLSSAIMFRLDATVAVHDGAPRRAKVRWVTPRFLSVLGVRPFVGSDFGAESARFGVPASTAIISWAFWQRELGGDPSALGRVIRVGSTPVTIRAITPRGFAGIDLEGADMWLPLAGFTGFAREPHGPPWYESWGTIAFRILVRAPAGPPQQQVIERVEAGMHAAAAYIKTNPRPGAGRSPVVRVVPGSLLDARGPEGMTQSEAIAALLAALSLLLLVMATANVGNLLLGRTVMREREITVRVALGMSRRRLIGLMATESLLLASLATIAAMVMAAWMGSLLRSMLLPGVEFTVGPLDARVTLLTLAVGVAVGILASLVPLSTALRPSLVTALKSTSRDGGGRHSRTRMALVGVQAALAVMLLIATGLMARSLVNIRAIDLGLDVNRVITVSRSDSAKGPSLEEIAAIARDMPGVTRAALSAAIPLDEQFGARAYFDRDGDTLRVAGLSIGFVAADPGYLDVVGTRMIRGRALTMSDRFGAPPVMVVSEELARRVWPGRNPIGECLRVERADAQCYSVVGVAEDAHSFKVIEDPRAVFYVPFDQRPERSDVAHALVVRTSRATQAIADRLRVLVGDTVAPTSRDPIVARRRQVHVMADMLASDYRPWELGARLFATFAGLALLLAIFGLYGVLSYLVALRTREIGIRMALGAERSRVMALVVRDGVRQVSVGAVAGAAIAIVLAGRLGALLFQVSPRDPTVVGIAVAVLIGCAALAAAIPGRRAMSIDPMTAIREE